MEPQINHQSEGMPLPASSPDMLPLPQPGQAPSPEAAPAVQELAPAQNQPAAAAPPLAGPMVPPADAQAPPAAQAAMPNATPAIADDVDLIEKEWVIKAKQIVEKTKDDPYNQSKELNKIKADYINKRYNKQIKLAEG